MMSEEEVAKYLTELDKAFANESVLYVNELLLGNEDNLTPILLKLVSLDAKIFALKMVLK